MSQGLEEADWLTRREIIRALVKQIEVRDSEVRIVYRVNTVPFAKGPTGGMLQDCRRRADALFVTRRPRHWPHRSFISGQHPPAFRNLAARSASA